jgi:hypothetical protein
MALPSSTADSRSRRDLEPLLGPPPYNPRDFTYFEDAERRWTGVAIYGATLLVAIALDSWVVSRGPPLPPAGDGLLMTIIGGVVMLTIPVVLSVVVGGEAALAALAAGLSLFVAGGAFVAGVDTAWSWTILGLVVVGGCCTLIGAGAAVRYWKLATADDE